MNSGVRIIRAIHITALKRSDAEKMNPTNMRIIVRSETASLQTTAPTRRALRFGVTRITILGMGAKRFLVIKLGAIGDVVHALPAVSLLRKLYPDAVIDWLVELKSAPILDGNPHISSRMVIDTRNWRRELFRHPFRVLSEILQVVARLKEARYDAAIDLQGLL